MILEPKHIEFLREVARGGRLGLADRANDRIRQRCRREGLAEVLPGPRRWSLTDRGRNVLSLWSEPTRAEDDKAQSGMGG